MKKRFSRRDYVYKQPTINADAFDMRRFNELLQKSKGLQRVLKEGNIFPMFDQLMGDIWASFFKNAPRLLDEVPEQLLNNRKIMERVMSDETYRQTHEHTKLDDLHSALSTIGFSEKVLEWIRKQVEDDQMHKKFANMRKMENENGKNSTEHQKAMQEFMQALGKHIENAGQELSEMFQESIQESKQTKQRLEELLSSIQPGKELENIPLKDQFTLAEHLRKNKKIRDIAEWTGRFKAIARAKQKTKTKETIARTGVTFGNEIEALLPSELILLSVPEARLNFLKNFAEGKTLQYATKGKSPLGKGPIILCLDQSASMRHIDSQSKGFTLALMSIAKKQKRDFALITFDETATTKIYPKGKITPQQMVAMCESFKGGGTNFRWPLEESLKLLKKSLKNADVVFVTDGQDFVPQRFLDYFNGEKKKHQFFVISLLIGPNADQKSVEGFSDRIYYAQDFYDESAHDVFQI